MVKFSRELEAQLIPEWKEAFVNYRQLKKHVKKIKISRLRSPPLLHDASDDHNDVVAVDDHHCGCVGFSLLHPCFRALAARFSARPPLHHFQQGDEENLYEMELVQCNDVEVRAFMEKLEEELEKVNKFYACKESEFCKRGEDLLQQIQILVQVKEVLHRYTQQKQTAASGSPASSAGQLLSRISSTSSSFSTEGNNEQEEEEEEEAVAVSSLRDEVIAVLEKNQVSVMGQSAGRNRMMKSKGGGGGKPRMTAMRIDIPATTPGRTISAVTSMMWEDVINSSRKVAPPEESVVAEGRNNNRNTMMMRSSGSYVTRKKVQCAEKMIRSAFVELYRGLDLLNTYSSLNMVAFTKILKKFDKVANQKHISEDFSKKVKSSHFVGSDKVVKLADKVECLFTQHFAGNDKKKAMKFLKPRQPKDSHVISFFVGLFTGSFVTLFTVYAILAHFCGIFSSSTATGYVETIYPVFSMFALLSLHIFLYGCNLFVWRSTRINHNFIFEFSSNTALKHRDAFLICTSIMTTVIAALVIQLVLRSTNLSAGYDEALPGTLLMLLTVVLLCPFDIFYRSTRYCFLRVIRNIVFSPFYKVLMVDFFMADQLTSQIQLLRHMEFTTCYFMAGAFKMHSYDTCTHSQQLNILTNVISFLPYYWRAMQCFRRFFEEGRDWNHIWNAGKYTSAMIAAAYRLAYATNNTNLMFALVVVTSTAATTYQLYWDFVKDWGLLNRKSKNPWLRDELILKSKGIYFVSMITNLILRLGWVVGLMPLSMGQVEHRMVDFILASLEIIRRGHWNFYRLENEHLNNVGKFRAVKTVPLPFREMESD